MDPARPSVRRPAPSRARLGELTHLRHEASLLVRDWRPSGPDAFTLTVAWPPHDGPGPYDPRLLAQTVRQSGLVVAHAEYGVPTGHQTLLHRLTITSDPGFRAKRGAQLQVDVRVTRAGRRASSLAMEFRIRRQAVTVCMANAEFGWVSPAAYRRVRGPHAAVRWGEWPLLQPVAPPLVGRVEVHDVLLGSGGTGHRWRLRNDVSSTLLFDHPVDHVPGLVLLDAAHQAAHAAARTTPFQVADVTIGYTRYVEFDADCWIETRPLPTLIPHWHALQVTGRQEGKVAFEARLRGVRLRS